MLSYALTLEKKRSDPWFHNRLARSSSLLDLSNLVESPLETGSQVTILVEISTVSSGNLNHSQCRQGPPRTGTGIHIQ